MQHATHVIVFPTAVWYVLYSYSVKCTKGEKNFWTNNDKKAQVVDGVALDVPDLCISARLSSSELELLQFHKDEDITNK